MTEQAGNEKLIRVKSSTDCTQLAASVQATYTADPTRLIVLRTIGAGALNQATKACIIANRDLVRQGLVINLIPSFKKLVEPNGDITAIELTLKFLRV